MKKFFVSLLAFLAVGLCAEAQEKLDTYLAYDVIKDAKVSVQDVTTVVDRAKKANASDPQVVDAAPLNAVLQANSQASIEAKLGITPAETHKYVDLGLSVKWATCNVGADKPEDYGDYFAWGETETRETYNWRTYFDSHDLGNSFIKYYNDGGKTQLDPKDDVAHVKWGGNWRMPTEEEFAELRNTSNCTWTWTTQGGKNGFKVTSKKNGNSIFLPATGFYKSSSLLSAGYIGHYWTSSLYTVRSFTAWYVYFGSGNVARANDDRCEGRCVRPVCP